MIDLTLRPDLGTSLRWSAGAALLLALGVWFLRDSSGAPQMWILFAVSVAVSLYFLLQLGMPGWFEVHLDNHGVQARTAWQHLDIPWERVQRASVRSFAGEAYLRLEVIEPVDGGWVVNPVSILLPLGANVAALHTALARARARAAARVDAA